MQLTIGVPTFNRFNEISKFIDTWKLLGDLQSVELLISDNCSSNYNIADLMLLVEGLENVRVVQTDHNSGMTGNIYNIFLHARGDFVLLSSDEDRLICATNIESLLHQIIKTNGYYYSTPFVRSNMGSPYNYTGINKSRLISIGEFHSSNFYLSGGVYKTKDTRKILRRINDIKEDHLCAHLYPHSLITAEFLLLEKKCFWLNLPLIREGTNLKPNSSMPDNTSYNYINSRYEQFISFIQYFNSLNKDYYNHKNIETLIKCHEMNFTLWLRWGLATSNIQLLKLFDKSLIRTARILIYHKLITLLSAKERYFKKITNETTRATWILTRYGKKR